jgi:F-type H+-transporting ATPase subunit b
MILLHTILANTTEPEGIAALGIDPLAIVAGLITFSVFFWVVNRFALKGMVAKLEERRVTINKGVDLGVEMEAAKAELDTKVEELLRAARKEADSIIAEAHSEHGKIVAEASYAASKLADDILKSAENHVAAELSKARALLRSEVAELVSHVSGLVLHEKLDSTADKEFIKRMVDKQA